MSPNDPYVVSDSTRASQITVIVNTSHPYWTTQLQGAESVRDYLRQRMYDSVAEWQARARASRIDPDTVKLPKDFYCECRYKLNPMVVKLRNSR